MSDTVSVRKGDLDILVAAVTSWAPHDVPMEASEAFARMLTAFDEAHDDEYRITEAGKAAADEDKPAKVVVVVEPGGRERHYAAPNFGMLHDGTLVIGDKTSGDDLRVDAALAPGRWATVHIDGATLPDSTKRALGIAKLALGSINERFISDDLDEDLCRVLDKIARDALEQIAGLDL